MNLDLIERPTFEPHLGIEGSVSTVVLGGARDNDFVVMQVLADCLLMYVSHIATGAFVPRCSECDNTRSTERNPAASR